MSTALQTKAEGTIHAWISQVKANYPLLKFLYLGWGTVAFGYDTELELGRLKD